MSKRTKLKLPNRSREYADIDYLDKLSEEDREFMMQFIDGYYNNNHRKYEIFTEHENYEQMKKELYLLTNARNRCGQSRDLAKNNLMELDRPVGEDQKLKLEDLLRSAHKDSKNEDILSMLGVHGFEYAAEKLIDDTLHDLSNYDKDHSLCLIRFYIKMKKLIKEEKKINLNERKIAKEREER